MSAEHLAAGLIAYGVTTLAVFTPVLVVMLNHERRMKKLYMKDREVWMDVANTWADLYHKDVLNSGEEWKKEKGPPEYGQ